MRDALRAEWTKLCTTWAPAGLLLAAVVATVALGVALHGTEGFYLGQAPIAVLGVLTVSGEYGTALIGVTLAAMPDRRLPLAAKALTLTGPVAVAGLVARGPVVYLVLIAWLSVGVAAIVRDSGVAIGVVLGLLYLPPIVSATVADPHVHRLIDRTAPMTGGLGALAAWAAAALLVGTLVLGRREVC
ncbi:ABC transporter permease [Cryptosporangium sp. NPDC051539]|uniref:ABC transporter permease n=1 Tax=Cryptosporangium sp. NPDC051539 TaxID=3363962 RepID=UPI0037AD3FB4